MESDKYGRTPHLPSSPGGTDDDERLVSASHLAGRELVITEKMDGANWCMTRDACFARSHSGSTRNPLFDPAKALWAATRRDIDEGVSIFGEWLCYRHTIPYTDLPAALMLFGVRNDVTKVSAPWEDVELWAEVLELPAVPVLWRGIPETEEQLLSLVAQFAHEPSRCGGEREGVVVRIAGEIADADWRRSIAKWVRAGHIQRTPSIRERNVVREG